MDKGIHYRAMRAGEEAAVSALIMGVFRVFVGPEYPPQGRETFRGYTSPEALAARSREGHFALVAEGDVQLAGVIEMRQHRHVSLLFVDHRFHRRGVARGLLQRALEIARQAHPELQEVTVNSSPYAVPVYERLGFAVAEPPKTDQGMTFIPMVLSL